MLLIKVAFVLSCILDCFLNSGKIRKSTNVLKAMERTCGSKFIK